MNKEQYQNLIAELIYRFEKRFTLIESEISILKIRQSAIFTMLENAGMLYEESKE